MSHVLLEAPWVMFALCLVGAVCFAVCHYVRERTPEMIGILVMLYFTLWSMGCTFFLLALAVFVWLVEVVV